MPPDFRAVPAGAITADDAFGAFEAELAKFGFAIIHNKIVVIDPFSDNCAVVTGSHNLGFRASHNNDENMVIVRGHRELAEAYACHVLDIYDHYAWRFLLKQHPDIFGRPLEPDDKWQERYIIGQKSPELRFWLSAAQTKARETTPAATVDSKTNNAGKTKKPPKVKSAGNVTKKATKKKPKTRTPKPAAKKSLPRKKKRT